jgi:hypothetical protein
MEGLDAGEFSDAAPFAPCGKAAGEVTQHIGRFAEAEIAAPTRIRGAGSSIVVSMLTLSARRVMSRIRA